VTGPAELCNFPRPTRPAFAGRIFPLEGDTQPRLKSGLFIREVSDANQTSWTPQAPILVKGRLARLRAHSRSKSPVKKMAKTMKTEGALRQKALSLGLPLGHRR
jgi:hypothetical protein